MENDKLEDIESKLTLITYCIAELHAIINLNTNHEHTNF